MSGKNVKSNRKSVVLTEEEYKILRRYQNNATYFYAYPLATVLGVVYYQIAKKIYKGPPHPVIRGIQILSTFGMVGFGFMIGTRIGMRGIHDKLLTECPEGNFARQVHAERNEQFSDKSDSLLDSSWQPEYQTYESSHIPEVQLESQTRGKKTNKYGDVLED